MKTLIGLMIAVALLLVAEKTYAEKVTYVDDVAAIINDNCVVCHREGGIGPMTFESYEAVRPWSPLIQYKVASREMPPYAYDENIGIQNLHGDWRLSQKDIDTLIEWVDMGSEYGDTDRVVQPPDLPDPSQWSFYRDFGEPTLVIPSIPIDIPASGNDIWHKHNVASGLTEDRCIKAVQVKPRGDAKSVVHHANSTVILDGERYGMLTEYAMGKWGEIVPDNVCRTLPANAEIAWDIHMFPGGLGSIAPGTMIKDNVVEIGLWLYSAEESKELTYKQDLKLYRIGDQNDITIPPNDYYMTQAFHSFDHPVRIDSWQPHGHLRMNAASFEIFYPETGRTEAISQVSNWSATWHHSHIYDTDYAPLVPQGAVLVLKQWYDNTADNPNNPDSDMWVVGGSRTGDEMTHAWIAVTHLDDEKYQELLTERKERRLIAQ
tara:strand:- start:1062 stop:2360 length:1299 start_codon:yes stop_codon:yes gene_type:complete